MEASFTRDIFPFLQIKKKQITHYDHFFDDHGTEIIVLPSYISNENVSVLSPGFRFIELDWTIE